MQIRLSKSNAKNLKQLVRNYKKTCRDYDLSPTKQANLLLSGRLGIALKESEGEMCKGACDRSKS